ncbi:hypothetical protein Nepgr_008206 [Nepenthes gracilis]|uniref:Scarecrow-like protein 32 n=1 Tax=Nepenthes gracilis TaxID=150966 RepID=A0AAD3S9A2_NEPGR|nr:hypothetical protein Nepgr_008206 [Nepenthes gracilis]
MNNSQTHRLWPWPGFPTSSKALGSFGDANCMEQLLVYCANAIENNDATLSHQILWVINNIASPDGDSNQRLTCAFLRALIVRAAMIGTSEIVTAMARAMNYPNLAPQTHRFSVLELANFVDLTPWHRFGFTAANAAILDAVEGYSAIHIVDLSLTHCMQIPTLIDAIATRLDGPPLIKLTVAGLIEDIPPIVDLFSYDEMGLKLVNFARSRNISLVFKVIPCSSSDGFARLIEYLRILQQQQQLLAAHDEALVINCQMTLHCIPDETAINITNSDSPYNSFSSSCPVSSSSSSTSPLSARAMFLKAIRSLNPTTVVLVDEDAYFTTNDLVDRLRSAFNYLWIPYDTVDTFLPRGSKQRQWYEAYIRWKIENVIAHEGFDRVERQEPKGRWAERMREANFRAVAFGEAAATEVKIMLDEHAAGWGSKKAEDNLVLTWKGHNVVFATAWVPA